jgi:hypothetical protein
MRSICSCPEIACRDRKVIIPFGNEQAPLGSVPGYKTSGVWSLDVNVTSKTYSGAPTRIVLIYRGICEMSSTREWAVSHHH